MINRLAVCLAVFAAGVGLYCAGSPPVDERAARADGPWDAKTGHRSPVDVVLTPDGQWLLTANQTSDTVSLVRAGDGTVASEVACGKHPSAIALSPDGRRVLVSGTYSGELNVLAIEDGRLQAAGSVRLGFEPRGIAVSPDGRVAYVALTAANEVAVVDLESLKCVANIAVGRWPRYLAITPDGTRLAIGESGDGGISVVDTQARQKLYDSKFVGLNIGHVQTSADGRYAYFPWMVYADRPITAGNIREGWVLGNRVARVRLDGPARREAMALDPRGRAVADPHGLALSPDEKWLALSASGTHELVLFRLDDLPLRADGPGDHLKPEIARDDDRFFRVPLGGRPMGIRFDRSGERVFVANYLANSIQVVNLAERSVERTIALGGPNEPPPVEASDASLARRGEAIFYDAQRSADGWYSCHSCHYEGDANAVTMDTKNDGSFGTYKMVLSLRNVRRTGPWFWHGWQQDFDAALRKSLAETMQGPPPTDADVRALAAFLDSMPAPPNSHRRDDGGLSAQAQRGKQVFESASAGCASCHRGKYFTDGQIHDVGLASEYDVYDGYNTPSLVGIDNRAHYLHHGRADTLDELLTDLHSPEKVSGTRPLTDAERADLIAYLKSL
jgi:YVTN family beta-propeller protein